MDHTLDFKTKFFKLEKSDLIASQDKYIKVFSKSIH